MCGEYVHTGPTLAAGTWVINAKVSLDQHDVDHGLVVHCRLDASGQTYLDEAMFKDWDTATDIVDLTMFTTVTSDGTNKVSIVCADGDVGDVYWNNARLLAMKVA